ncbi:MAG: Gfo/Idh/MocA family oxidoreductase [Pirellulales bacterium]
MTHLQLSRPTRRQFVASSIISLAAASAASTAARAAGANRKVVLGIMGTNGRGTDLAGSFAAQSDCEVAYICDVDQRALGRGVQAAVDRGGGKHPAPRTVGDFRRILDDKAVDALVIAAPDHWHGPATILACQAGKHVYVEKPASHNGREGLLMVAAARKHNRVVQLGTQRRSSPRFAEAVECVRRGDIGRALMARGWITSTRPSIGRGKATAPPKELDYALWQGPAPDRPYQDNIIHYHWHWFWQWGTGELGNNGIHALDICRWGLGVDWPTRVTCGGGKLHFNDDQETPDTQLATFHFEQAATPCVIQWEHRTWNRRGFENESSGVAFYGEKGSLVVLDSAYTLYDLSGKKLEQVEVRTDQAAHSQNFLDAIRGTAKLNAEIEEGVKSTTMCHLGNIAYRTGRSIRYDAANTQIVDDAEAAKLWTRQYRDKWEPKI